MQGMLTEAWHNAWLYAAAKTKKFPKSPEAIWKRPEAGADVLVAAAKTRLAAQESAKRRAAKGRDKVIHRPEE